MIKSDKIYALILKETKTGPITWAGIKQAIESHNLQPTHPHTWLAVRGVLQGLINQGEIRRTNDVHSEVYERVGDHDS